MIQVNVNDARIEAGVLELAEELHLPAEAVVHHALEQMLSDRADYRAGLKALQSVKYTVSANEMERRSELAD
jgi:hypothetical protein